MSTTTDHPPVAPPEFDNMSKVQKLAALLVVLGPESAAQVLKTLDEPEIESITTEMAKLVLVSPELQTDVLREFTEVALQASTSVRGGVDMTQNALEKALGAFKAS